MCWRKSDLKMATCSLSSKVVVGAHTTQLSAWKMDDWEKILHIDFSQSSIFHAPMELGGDWWTSFWSLPFSSFQIRKSYFFQIRIYLGTCTYLGVIFLAERRISFIIYETIHSPALLRKKSTSILLLSCNLLNSTVL